MFNFAKYLEIRFKSTSVTLNFGSCALAFGPRRSGLQSCACAPARGNSTSRTRFSGLITYATGMRVYEKEQKNGKVKTRMRKCTVYCIWSNEEDYSLCVLFHDLIIILWAMIYRQ